MITKALILAALMPVGYFTVSIATDSLGVRLVNEIGSDLNYFLSYFLVF